MSKKSLTKEQALALLAETPRRIAELTEGLTPKQLRMVPTEGEWSVNAVVAHLRACADIRGESIPAILNAERPTLRAVDPRRWMTETNYLDLEFAESFQAFVAQRSALLTLLESLAPEDWERSAIVTGAGAPLERSVLFYAGWVAIHERPHVKQVARIVKELRS